MPRMHCLHCTILRHTLRCLLLTNPPPFTPILTHSMLRFGDAGLHACEVLLKDMADSKRLDTNIR